MSPPQPPRVAFWILEHLVPAEIKDAIVGDLIEEHTLRSQSTAGCWSSWWYLSQVLQSVLPLVGTVARRRQWIRLIMPAIGAYGVVTIIESGWEIVSAGPLATNRNTHALGGLLVGLSAMAFGGYVATAMRQGASIVLAVLIAMITAGLMTIKSDSAPLWYQIGFLGLGPLAAVAGGSFRRRDQCG